MPTLLQNRGPKDPQNRQPQTDNPKTYLPGGTALNRFFFGGRFAPPLALLATVLATLTFAAAALAANPGDLDTTFDGDGIRTVDASPGVQLADVEISETIVGPSGTFVAGSSGGDILVALLNADGSLNTTFGGSSGFRLYDANNGSTPDDVGGIAVDASGRLVVAGRADSNGFILRINTDGSLDTTFDGDGRVIRDEVDFFSFADVAIDSAGGIYAVFEGGYPSRVFKYTTSGALDSSFGSGGITTAASAMNDPEIAIDGNDFPVVAGSITGSDYRVYRLYGPGAFHGFYDSSFGSGGVADFTAGSGSFIDLEIDGSNRPVLLGDGLADGYELVRLTTAGAADTSFSFDGVNTLNPQVANTDEPADLTIHGAKGVVVGESDSAGTGYGFITVTLDNGAFDGTYMTGCDGGVECPYTAVTDDGTSLYVMSEERPTPSDPDRLYASKFDASMNPDFTFGSDSKVNHAKDEPWDETVIDSTMTADGSIYTLGSYGQYGNSKTYIHKQLADGSPDAAFGVAGTVTHDIFPSSEDYTSALAVSGGAVFVAGSDLSGSPMTGYIAKYNAAGLDTLSGFGAGGIASIAPSANDVYPGAIEVDDSGRLVLAGGEINGGTRSVWLQRFDAGTGASDFSFNAGGAQFYDFSGDSNEYLSSIAFGEGGQIYAAGPASGNLGLMNVTSSGALDISLGGGGIEITAPNNYSTGESAEVATRSGIVYVFGTATDTAGTSIRGLKIIDTASELNLNAGTASVDNGANAADKVTDAMVDSAGRVTVVGHTEQGSSQRDSVVARFTSDFALDSSFSGDGVVTSDLSGAFREDRFDNVFERSGKIVAVGGKLEPATGASLLMTAQYVADLPAATPTTPAPPPATDLCTPAKKRLSALKKKLKKQKKLLIKTKSAVMRKKRKKQIRTTNKRIKKARASVRRLCTT